MRKQESEGANLDFESNSNHSGNLKIAPSDQSLLTILDDIKSSKSPAVINYGASWYVLVSLFANTHSMLTSCLIKCLNETGCGVCSQIFPAFQKLSSSFSKLKFVYADIDECPETTRHIRYTPTFQFYRDGEKVDEMFGAGEERLHDRLWLHS